jgi:AcrR family transcriptional regulator
MTTQKKQKDRVSKSEWLEKALDILKEDGLDEVKIDRLAKELEVSRSGFYWHFENRQALLRAMLQYWEEEFTAVVTTNSNLLKSNPKDRVYETMKMILESNLTRMELAMRVSAEKDPLAMEILDRVYQKRLEFIRSTFAELGFEGDDLEMRTHLFVCYHTWEGVTFQNIPKSKRASWIKIQLELLCSPTESHTV